MIYNESMRILRAFIITLFIAAMLAGCKDNNPAQQYGEGLTEAYKSSQDAGDMATLDSIKKTVEFYYANNQKFPASLKEIGALMGVELDETKFAYDPATGQAALRR